MDWSLLRDADTMSARNVPVDWRIALFQHLDCLGDVQAKQAYNFGHDIYSLGDCLLEIALWESLVSADQDTQGSSSEYKLSDRFIDMAASWNCLVLASLKTIPCLYHSFEHKKCSSLLLERSCLRAWGPHMHKPCRPA